MMHNNDPHLPWIGIEEGTEYIHRISRLTAVASRRQVVADTISTCVVSDFVPTTARHDERLGEFIYDIDGNRGPMAIVGWRHSVVSVPDCRMSVNTRKDDLSLTDILTPPSRGAVDLDLGHYSDVYSTEDLVQELPIRASDGFADTSNIGKISKVIPWYDEFVESFKAKSLPSFSRVTKLARISFIKLKILYWRLASLYYSMYAYNWLPVTASRRLEILRFNFPRGILGFRALMNPDDPRIVRSLVMKEADNKRLGSRRHLQTFTVASSIEEKEKDELVDEFMAPINPHATVPDLTQTWQLGEIFPRVHFEDTNRVVNNMPQIERESMNSMAVWSLVEVRVFLEKLAIHGKNFKRIASSIVDKSERDCVEFYYRFKIHLNMKAIISAGSVSRQDRRMGAARAGELNSNQSTPILVATTTTASSYKAMIDEIIETLEANGHSFLSTKSMEVLNLRYRSHRPSGGIKNPAGDESPKRERRNAMIELIVAAIGKGQPVPLELGIVEPVITPPLSPPPPPVSAATMTMVTATHVAEPLAVVPAPSRRVSLSVVQTEISVLTLPEERVLQHYYTI